MKRTIGSRATPRRNRLALCLAAALGIVGDGTCGGVPVAGNVAALQPAALVTNCDDDGPGSLRQAAAGGSDIDLTRLTCSTIELTRAIGLYTNDIVITGPGADRLTISSASRDRVFNHLGGGTLEIVGLTIANGSAGGNGGCISSQGNVTLDQSIVTGCNAMGVQPLGGGIYAAKTLAANRSSIIGNTADGSDRSYGGGAFARHSIVLYRSTVSDNVATGSFGNTGGVCSLASANVSYSTISNNRASYNAGIAAFGEEAGATFFMSESTVSGNVATLKVAGAGTLAPSTIVNSTIAFNRSPSTDVGSGLFVHGEAHLVNTIVADNAAAVDLGGYSDAFITGSHNLITSSSVTLPADTITSDPMLAPLADAGGATMTHALLPGSPAIDAGTDATSLPMNYDQRFVGYGRTLGNAPDLGAYEKQSTGIVHAVSSCDDGGVGSLRETVSLATAGDTIDLRGLACSTITLTTGAIETGLAGLTVLGPGRDALTISGNDADRVIDRDQGTGTLLLSGLTIAHGSFATGNGYGGCIRNYGVLALDRTTVTGCSARSDTRNAYGGAIFTWGLRMNESRIENSRASGARNALGGGAYAHDATLVDSIVRGNVATAGSGSYISRGGGLYVGGRTDIAGSTIAANQADLGGGLYSNHGAKVVDSTISGNASSRFAGGIWSRYPLLLANSTVAFNSAGGAYQVAAGVVGGAASMLESTIAFGNMTGGGEYDVGAENGGVVVGSHNLVGASRITMPPDTIFGDPLLGPLQDNGGPTPTHAIGAGSPALDAGSNVMDLEHDQRGSGFVRVFGIGPDIGAFEMQGVETIFADGFD